MGWDLVAGSGIRMILKKIWFFSKKGHQHLGGQKRHIIDKAG